MPDPLPGGAGAGPATTELDTTLLAGFDFACQPECGLCCYAQPAVTPVEWAQLLPMAPELARIPHPAGQLPSRPRGGACVLLERCRCRVHTARPAPCAEFPLSTHLGPRIQVSLVLSCPGVSLKPLAEDWFGRPRPAPGAGLERELQAVRREAARLTEADRRSARAGWNRRWRAETGELEGLRAALLGNLPHPISEELALDPIPSESEGLETLPLFFDDGFGRVAFARTHDGIDALVIREGGGIDRRAASLPLPDHLPRIEEDGQRLLDGYLAYVVERDAFVGAGMAALGAGRSAGLEDQLRADLREIAAAVVARGVLRDWLHGGSGERLGFGQVANGIRATDADYLDRPTVGRWI